jgi:hypothetical protein
LCCITDRFRLSSVQSTFNSSACQLRTRLWSGAQSCITCMLAFCLLFHSATAGHGAILYNWPHLSSSDCCPTPSYIARNSGILKFIVHSSCPALGDIITSRKLRIADIIWWRSLCNYSLCRWVPIPCLIMLGPSQTYFCHAECFKTLFITLFFAPHCGCQGFGVTFGFTNLSVYLFIKVHTPPRLVQVRIGKIYYIKTCTWERLQSWLCFGPACFFAV